jgi:hypothetical protein
MLAWSVGIRLGWTLVALTIAACRLHGMLDNRFQAFAHIVVGNMLAAFAFGWAVEARHRIKTGYPFYGLIALFLTAVEVFAFLMGIGRIDGR